MKVRFVFLFVLSLLFAACASKEQKISEEYLKDSLKSPSSYKFVSFNLAKEETLGEEIEDRLEWIENESYGRRDYDKNAMISLLKSTEETMNTDKITFRTYRLEYDAQNSFGAVLRGNFYTRFNANGELVAYKGEDGHWVLLGRFFSIPGYYELLGQ